MIWFISSLVLFVIAVGAAVWAHSSRKSNGDGFGGILTASITGLLAVLFLFLSTFFTNSQGEAKVVVDAFDRHAISTVTTPMMGFKSPFQDLEDFDMFAQDLTYAGPPNGNAPAYAGGKVNGYEVTISVGGLNGGSTQGWADMQVVYNIKPDFIQPIYDKYKTQPRFTQMIVEKQTLNVIRQIPSSYTAVEFRGTKRADAAAKIQSALNTALNDEGVEVTSVTIQDVRYSAEVENALKNVEVATQNKLAAAADAESKVIAAKGSADAAVAAAKGEADANKLISESLTEKVLQSRYIDAIREAGTKGGVIVTDGDAPVIVNK